MDVLESSPDSNDSQFNRERTTESANSPAARAVDVLASLRVPEFRYWLVATAFSILAGRALVVALGYQIYVLSHAPLALGILGLAEAIPAVGLALVGGHAADRYDRRTIVLVTGAVSVV